MRTHDRFSLTVNGSVGLVGGVTTYSAALSESNLFGKGKRIGIAANKDDIDESVSISYTDPQFLDGRHRLFLAGGATSEGPFGLIQLTRPFQYLEDPRSYGGSLGYGERDVDYFLNGDVVASVPQRASEVSAFVSHGFGPRDVRSTIGLDSLSTDKRYGAAFGPAAPLIRVPGDTREVQLGFTYTVDYAHSFRKETHIDTIDFIQDIELGVGGRSRVAGVLRDEDGVGLALEPLFEAELRSAIAPLPETYLTIDLRGSMRFNAGDLVGWRASTALHAYQKSLPFQTLAASLTFDGAKETENLPVQLTLGEDNGLRGYPAREFAGDRFVRLNLEDRIYTGLEVLSVDIGLVAFFDVGWIHSELQSLSMSQAFRGAGFGLRLGSNELLGGRVIRIDLAWPLDSVPGQDYSVSLSFGSGQVFTFFGNQSDLTTEF